jgi:hypothetical protein
MNFFKKFMAFVEGRLGATQAHAPWGATAQSRRGRDVRALNSDIALTKKRSQSRPS